MDRNTAILKAQVIRFNHLVLNTSTGRVVAESSISLAKKATRGFRCVKAKDGSEFTRLSLATQERLEREEAARKEAARLQAEADAAKEAAEVTKESDNG